MLDERYSIVERKLYSSTNRGMIGELLTGREFLDGAIAYLEHELHEDEEKAAA